MKDFGAYQLYQEIRNGARVYDKPTVVLNHEGQMQEFEPDSHRELQELERGITFKAFYSYFRTNLSPGTLKSELTEQQCNFLVNIMTDNNQSFVSYEQFLDFIIPWTKKKITKKLVNKIKQKNLTLDHGQLKKCKYNAVCTLAKLFECEV